MARWSFLENKKFKYFFTFLLTLVFFLSIQPFLASFKNDLEQNPIETLKWKSFTDPFNYRWPFLLGKAFKAIGQYEKAEKYLTRSLMLNPLVPETWISLSDLYAEQGRKTEIYPSLLKASFLDPQSSYIRWQILIRALSFDFPESITLAKEQIKKLLILSPSKRHKLFTIAEILTNGSIEELVPHERTTRISFLYWLMSHKKFQEALTVWNEIKGNGWENEKLFKYMVNSLIGNRLYTTAWKIWRSRFKDKELIHNGGFEKDILGYGFGWRWYPKIKGLKGWGFSYGFRIEGRRSFYMVFDGEHNPYVGYPRQLVYLEKPGLYRLSAYVKSDDITSASGFRLEVWGKNVRAKSKEIKGYNPWRLIKVEFKVADEGPVWIAFVRRPTRKLNKFLGGKIWIDQVLLERIDGEEGVKGSS